MNTSQPIRKLDDLDKFKNYYDKEKFHPRNYLLINIGLNTALRISDLLSLQWNDVYDFTNQVFLSHITITEQKTQKISNIYMNQAIISSLTKYKKYLEKSDIIDDEMYLFSNQLNEPISRIQAYRIIKKAAVECNISGVISPHSLRKTFGYHAWKKGIEPALLMDVYNHSSFTITKRYLGIEQDDRDEVFRNVCL